MKQPALDFVSRHYSFDVYAYDSRFDIALLEMVSEPNEKPFKVVQGLTYHFDYEYKHMLSFKTKEEAYAIYDAILFAKWEELK